MVYEVLLNLSRPKKIKHWQKNMGYHILFIVMVSIVLWVVFDSVIRSDLVFAGGMFFLCILIMIGWINFNHILQNNNKVDFGYESEK
jgi:hypothetical protein